MSAPSMTGFWTWLKSLWHRPPRTFHQHLAAFFGSDYDQVPSHDKTYPGYDLASVTHALASFHAELTREPRELGAVPPHIRSISVLVETLKHPHNRMYLEPSPAVFQRMPIDVEEEQSFPTSQFTLSRFVAADQEGADDKIAVLLTSNLFAADDYDGMDNRTAPRQQLTLSIACHSKRVANRFFAEIEIRRKRLSIFRGKVIDPVVGPGGIATIGFRAIRTVKAEELVLPESVRTLLHSSILRFYAHRETLQELGIELKRGILFHGPPGTGKTSISLYLAGHLPNFTICFVSGERLLYPREICRMARYLQPTMLVFEDIDLVAQERNVNGLATVLGELMNQIDGCEPSDQVLFILNTNSLERLEHAVKNRPGRVDQIIAVPLPDREQREQLLRCFTSTLRLAIDDLGPVLDATAGTTPATLKEIVKRAVVAALEDAPAHNGEPLRLRTGDLLLATEQVRTLRDPEPIPGNFGFREGGFD